MLFRSGGGRARQPGGRRGQAEAEVRGGGGGREGRGERGWFGGGWNEPILGLCPEVWVTGK